ncbi:MAG: inner membrane protein YpjD [Myxococcaceae bacterium]
MTRSLLDIACHIYGLAAVVYLAFLVRQWKPLATAGRIVVASGLILHGISLALLLSNEGGAPRGFSDALSMLAFLLLAIFLLLDLRYTLPVAGAFLLPAALAVLVPSFMVGNGAGGLPDSVRAPLLPLHISVALLGIASFAAAAGVAVMYLLMERQVKGKKFGLLFSRLPSLHFLDELNRKLVVAGFIALSITLVTGAFFVSSASFFWAWQPKEIATVVAWVVFASLLNARVFAGWQGKRVAVLTMAGFCILLVSFLSSYNVTAVVASAGVH